VAKAPPAIQVQCKPLTPIWTGDIERRGDRVRETGMIGSLRWWYEAILRGCGFYACDPSAGTCAYEEYHGLANICLACQLFGCTGYSRRFRLEVEGEGGAGRPLFIRLRNPGTKGHKGWMVPQTLSGPFTLKLTPLSAQGLDAGGIGLTLRLIERFGALGAKTSQGQGVVQFEGFPEVPPVADWTAQMADRPHKGSSAQPPGAPNLQDLVGVSIALIPKEKDWWTKLSVQDQDLRDFRLSASSQWTPSAPVVRAMLRAELRNLPASTSDRHRLMGFVSKRGEPGCGRGSQIFVTHSYRVGDRWRMRIFGFVPNSNNSADQKLRSLLADSEQLRAKVAGALGLGEAEVVAVDPYPRGIAALLG